MTYKKQNWKISGTLNLSTGEYMPLKETIVDIEILDEPDGLVEKIKGLNKIESLFEKYLIVDEIYIIEGKRRQLIDRDIQVSSEALDSLNPTTYNIMIWLYFFENGYRRTLFKSLQTKEFIFKHIRLNLEEIVIELIASLGIRKA